MKDVKNLWELKVKDIDGKERTLNEFLPGKKAFVFMNVASEWGVTKVNYEQFTKIYEKYASKGLEIFGFPCNQFGAQEPKGDSEIKKYVTEEFGVKWPMFSKIETNGPNSSDVYIYIKKNSKEFCNGDNILDLPWNFCKFLLDASGKVVDYFDPKTNPEKMVESIEKLL